MRFAWLAVVVVAAFAGCADGSGTADVEQEPGGSEGPQPGLRAEGKQSAGDPPVPPAEPTPATPVEVPFDVEGFMGMGAYAGPVWATPLGSQRWFPEEVEGVVTGATLTMEWAATSPTTERLMMAFGILEEDGNGQYAEDYELARGTSPLVLEMDGLAWDEEDYVVFVWWDPLIAQASLDQPFTISGSIQALQ